MLQRSGPNGGLTFTLAFMVVIDGVVLVAVPAEVNFARGAVQWHSHNGQPIQTLPAHVVAKRSDVPKRCGQVTLQGAGFHAWERTSR